MKKHIFQCLLVIGVFHLASCDTAKSLFGSKSPSVVGTKSTKTELMRISESSVQTEEKMDFLFDQYVNMVQTGLQNSNTAKGAETIQKFQAQNKSAVDKIMGETNAWLDKMDKKQGKELGLRVVKKSYTRQFLDNVPAFNQKYKSYPAITEGVSKVMGIFTKIRSKAK
jgi:hypothetical protein